MQIGVDLGGTKIESVVLNDKGEVLYREREESPHNYQETLDSINFVILESPILRSTLPH